MTEGLISLSETTFLVALLARAAWHKAQAFPETTGFAMGYDLVPPRLVPPILRALIVAEALAALFLILPATRLAGATLAAGLFLGYGVLMALALGHGRRQIDCGCGGPPQMVSAWTVARNGMLATLAAIVAVLPAVAVGAMGAALAITAGLTAWAIYTVSERLASHVPYIVNGP